MLGWVLVMRSKCILRFKVLITCLVLQCGWHVQADWNTPLDLSLYENARDASDPHISMNTSGHAMAIWARSNGFNEIIQVSHFDGSDWSSPVDLSAYDEDAFSPEISLNDNGRAMAIWLTSNGSTAVIQASYFDGTTWATAVDLSINGHQPSPP